MITSTSNNKIKRLVSLRKKRKARDSEGVFLVEGIRMFQEVPKESLLELYVTEGFQKKEYVLVEQKRAESGCQFEVLSDNVMAYASDTQHPQGVLCVVRQQGNNPGQSAADKQCPLVMLLDNLQDPGNLGTILRTAEAAGVTEIIMSKDCVDVYNPKVIRSTMGSVFRVPFRYVEDVTETIREMKRQGIRTYAAHLDGKLAYDEPDYKEPAAFFIGNEGNGLRDEVAELADTYIRIPMAGQVESLNAAIAATVLMFEAGRQRRH